MDRILWDDVPDDVRDQLAARDEAEAPQEGAVAIVESADDGRRYYLSKEAAGWNCVNVAEREDRSDADDLTPEQRDERDAEFDALLDRITSKRDVRAAAEPQNCAGPPPKHGGSWGAGMLPVLKLVYGDGNPGALSVRYENYLLPIDHLSGHRSMHVQDRWVTITMDEVWGMHATRDQLDVLQHVFSSQCSFVLEEHDQGGAMNVVRSRCHPVEFRRNAPGRYGPVNGTMQVRARILDQEVLP